MKKIIVTSWLIAGAALCASAYNPYLPLWEYIPDGEPYVFDDPDNPGRQRVYIYGSHDIIEKDYCGRDQVVWSASVDSLDQWRYDGVIFENKLDRDGKPLNEGGVGDVLFAPDVTMVPGKDGAAPTYYLYPNDQHGGRNGLVAKSSRPDGPFEVCNWDPADPTKTVGVLGFDPAVFVDDDGRVYGYWGFGDSHAAELDPTTMATVKPGTEIITPVVNKFGTPGEFDFFEASSMRKIKDKYLLIYSRITDEGDFGLPSSNYTLAYAWSNTPLGPWTYGGTLIDGRGRHTLPDGTVIPTAHPNGNTHGSLCQIGDKWYIFYHRQCGLDEFSRQAMVAAIDVEVQEGPDGYVKIAEAEYTSEGFETDGLSLGRTYPAAIASHYTGPTPARHNWPNKEFSGPYPYPGRYYGSPLKASEEMSLHVNPVVNNTNGSILGYKYFNFDQLAPDADTAELILEIAPRGIDGTITVVVGDPYDATAQKQVGQTGIKATDPQHIVFKNINLSGLKGLRGKQPLYLMFASDAEGQSLCEVYTLRINP